MQCVTRPRITELNPHLLCVLCEGYLIDATAITECLHAFCKKCIVQYLETKKYCPVCDVLVHKTKPLQNIKPDKILQSIVYKSVPDLYKNEMCNRRKFYSLVNLQQHPENSELRGEITEASEFYTVNDTISLSLEYINFLGDQNYFYVASSSKRYLRCDASVTIKHLQKLISAKYGLAVEHEIRFFFNGIQLPEHLTLLDIAYISSWKRNGFIRLLYQILEIRKTVMKLEKKETTTMTTATPTIVKTEDKVNKLPLYVSNCVNNISVQAKESNLSTSSTTITSVTTAVVTAIAVSKATEKSSNTKSSLNLREPLPISSSLNTSLNNSLVVTSASILTPSTNLTACKSNENSVLNKIVEKLEKKASTGNSNVTLTLLKPDDKPSQPATLSNNKENTEKTTTPMDKPIQTSDSLDTNVSTHSITPTTTSLKKKLPENCPISPKIPKLLHCDLPKPSKSDICKEVESINTPIMSVNSTASVTSAGLKFIPSSPITPVFNYSASSSKVTPPLPPLRKMPMCYPAARIGSSEHSRLIELPSTTITSIKKPIAGVKTFTRPWNYSASPTAIAPVKPITITDSSKNANTQKPVKFHKARRNVPRFLGAPSSGIRPLYQGNSSGSSSTLDGKSSSVNDTLAKKVSRNISLLKVDPKTLAPITTTNSSKSSGTGANSVKKPFYMTPKMYTTIPDYPCSVTNTPNYIGSLPSVSASSPKLPSSAAFSPSFQNMSHSSLLNSINPFLCGIYQSHFPSPATEAAVNGPTSLDYIKAMAAYHPSFPPSLNSLYKPQHHLKLKHDKVKTISKPASNAPAVRRIPQTSKTSASSEANTATESSKTLPISSTPSSISNGVYKSKSKKESSFAINNLIPIDEAKNITHSCSADGVHQVCDQVLSVSDPVFKRTCSEVYDKKIDNKDINEEEKKITGDKK